MAIFKGDDDQRVEGPEGQQAVPLLPLKEQLVFPHMMVPLFVARERGVRALEAAWSGDREIALVCQRDSGTENPTREDLFEIGTIGTIVQLLKLPDGIHKVLVEGKRRARICGFHDAGAPYVSVEVEPIEEPEDKSVEIQALVRTVHSAFEAYVKLNKKVPSEMLTTVQNIQKPSHLADLVASQLNLSIEDRH